MARLKSWQKKKIISMEITNKNVKQWNKCFVFFSFGVLVLVTLYIKWSTLILFYRNKCWMLQFKCPKMRFLADLATMQNIIKSANFVWSAHIFMSSIVRWLPNTIIFVYLQYWVSRVRCFTYKEFSLRINLL